MDKISIITVTYNSEKYITDCIRSVNIQTYKNIEHIFIDGCSKDKTLNVIKTFSERPNLILSEPDKGIYDAMNKGISLASGDIVGILNSDDLYDNKNIIEEVAKNFKSFSGHNILWGDLNYVAKNNTNKPLRIWQSRILKKDDLLKGKIAPHPTFFIRKKLFTKIGLYDLSMPLAADFDFMKRCLIHENYKAIYVPKKFIKMRVGGVTSSSFRNIYMQNKEIIRSLKFSFSDFSLTRYIFFKFAIKLNEKLKVKM